LNALLKFKNGPSLKPIIDFLELDKAKILLSRHALLDNGFVGETAISRDSGERHSETQQSIITDSETTHSMKNIETGSSSPKNPIAAASNRGSQPLSLMDVAQNDAENNPNNSHEKWRKLFYQMKIKLKPGDIAVRCRLFEGVISGGEIAAWLIRSTSANASTISPTESIIADQQANNRVEACAIGQELVTCGLISPVSCGFIDEEHEYELDGFETEVTTDRSSMIQIKGPRSFNPEDLSKFSDLHGYIYRFPVKSGTAGSWTLFGGNHVFLMNCVVNYYFLAPIAVKIPMMTIADENENMKSTRDTVILTIDSGLLAAETDGDTAGNPTAPPTAAAGGHVKYVIDISHGTDKWQTVRRLVSLVSPLFI
jgi:hypothetical protein